MERECSLLLLSKKPEPSDRFRILPVACGVLFHDWVGERTDFQRGIQMPRRFSYDYPAWSESVLFYCSAKSQSLLTGSGFCLSLAACFSTIGLGSAQISRGAFRCRAAFRTIIRHGARVFSFIAWQKTAQAEKLRAAAVYLPPPPPPPKPPPTKPPPPLPVWMGSVVVERMVLSRRRRKSVV